VVYCVRDSLREFGLGHILSPESCNVGSLVEPARESIDAFVHFEALLARAAQWLIEVFAREAERDRLLPPVLIVPEGDFHLVTRPGLIIQPDVVLSEPATAQAEQLGTEITTAMEEANRRGRKTFATMVSVLRLNAHRAITALDAAIQAASAGEDRSAAEAILTDLLELARSIGLADERPLSALWPRLCTRVVEVERLQHHLALRESRA
jgi:hypothetical protein